MAIQGRCTMRAPRTPVRAPPALCLPWCVEKIPLLVLSVACSMAAVVSQGRQHRALESLPISARIANALISYAVYLGQFFWPVGLAAFYPRSENLPAWQVAGAVLVLAALSAGRPLSWRKQPAVLVGWLWYLGTLVPMIGLVPIGAHARADRYTYLPQIGLCIAWSGEHIGSWSGFGEIGGVRGSALWRGRRAAGGRFNGLRLATDLVLAEQRATMDPCLGLHFEQQYCALQPRPCAGRPRDGSRRPSRNTAMALQVNPTTLTTHNNLGLALAGRGEFDEAIAHYLRALQLKPDFALADNNLGIALARRGQVEEAMADFRKAMEIKPDLASAHYNLGLALADRGQVEEAIAQFRKALACRRRLRGYPFPPGRPHASRGPGRGGHRAYRRVLEIQPDSLPPTSTWCSPFRPWAGRGGHVHTAGAGNRARLRGGP